MAANDQEDQNGPICSPPVEPVDSSGQQDRAPESGKSPFFKVLREHLTKQPDADCRESVCGPAEVQIFKDIPKSSKLDQREYRGVILPNGLRVMLVSDPNAERSAASLDVNVGCWSDPPELQGLAHYLEHMLFLGTEKYPDPSEYSNFISKHGGTKNAYTISINTNFYFTIASAHLEPALDRFVQFFISPKFDVTYMEKELQSVQAEFELHFDSDSAKSERVNRETCDQSHDSAKFGTGNRKTLKEDPEAQGIDVRERLLEFYSKHYSANVMTLCVLGKDSLDELQAMIIERLPFSEIQNKQIDLKQRCELLEKSRFREAHLQKEIRIVPKKEMCELLIDFHPFEWFESLSVEHKFNLLTAYAYLSNLFNQKHDGSVLAELKDRRGLVEDVMFCPNGIYFRLEKDGISTEKVDEIVATVFQFLHFAKRDGIQRWIHEEMNTIQEIALNNEETVEPLTLISAIAIKMQWFKIEWVVKFAFSDLEFKPALIEQLIDNLKPEHMRLTLISKQFEGKTDRKEKYYGIQYSYETIDQKRVDRWNDVGYNENFVLHKPNEYIAANFELVEREKEEHRDPVLIKQELAFESWFLQDSRFKTPRASYYVQLKNPFLPPDLVAEKTMQLFCQLLRESLKEHSRLAAQAGIFSSIGLANAFAGLVIELSGYSDKLPALLATIMDRLIEFEPDRERFEKLKEEEIRRLKNLPKRPMKTILLSYWQLLSSEYRHSVEETLDCMEQVTFEQLAGVRERFFSQLFVKQFVYGNVTRADADRVESLTKSRLIEVYRTSAALKVSFVIRRLLKLDDNAFYVYHRTSEEHHQNAISSCFQIGPETPANFVKTCLVVRLLKQHFYNELRTEEQLGYSVMMNLYSLFKVQSIAFCIQSSYSVEYLDERVQQFIGWATDHLSKLTDEEFDSHKEGMRTLYAEPIRRLSTQSAKFWGQISSDALQFDRREAILAALEEVSKEDVVGLFNEHLVRNPRKLFIRITGTKKIAGQAIGARAAGLLVNGLSRIGGHLSGGLSSLAEMAGLKVAGGLGGEALEKKPGDESIDVKLDELQLSQNGKLVADNVPKGATIINHFRELHPRLGTYPNPKKVPFKVADQ